MASGWGQGQQADAGADDQLAGGRIEAEGQGPLPASVEQVSGQAVEGVAVPRAMARGLVGAARDRGGELLKQSTRCRHR
jgi:hypothetical protein